MALPPVSLLSGEAIALALAEDLTDWTLKNPQTLARHWRFKDFTEAMSFVVRVALLAEAQAHHPDIRIVYNQVWLELSTHDAGGLTERDLTLARAIG